MKPRLHWSQNDVHLMSVVINPWVWLEYWLGQYYIPLVRQLPFCFLICSQVFGFISIKIIVNADSMDFDASVREVQLFTLLPFLRIPPKMEPPWLLSTVGQFHRLWENWAWHSSIAIRAPENLGVFFTEGNTGGTTSAWHPSMTAWWYDSNNSTLAGIILTDCHEVEKARNFQTLIILCLILSCWDSNIMIVLQPSMTEQELKHSS